MTPSEKQAAIAAITTKMATQFMFHPSGAGKAPLGCLKPATEKPQMMFFKSKAQGLGILGASVKQGIISADEAPRVDVGILASGLPDKHVVGRFSLDAMDGKLGMFLRLLENKRLMAMAGHINSAEELHQQIDNWIAAYNISAGAVEQMKMKFFSTTRLFVVPEEKPENLPYVLGEE